MGRQAQLKRARREQAEYAASLTTCEGTWIEKRPVIEELRRIDAAIQSLKGQVQLINQFKRDEQAANLYSLELFRDPAFAPLHLEDWLVEQMLAAVGEPPVVEDQNDPLFANYLRRAVLSVATSRMRSALAGQLRRFLPQYVERGQFKDAVAIDYNAFRTALGNEVSPFLVQMTLQALARWYETHDEEDEQEEVSSS
jgi:hypothetical protein